MLMLLDLIYISSANRVPCKKALGLWGLPYQKFDNNNNNKLQGCNVVRGQLFRNVTDVENKQQGPEN